LKFSAHASYTNYRMTIRADSLAVVAYTFYADDCFICPKRTATLTEATYDETTLPAEIKSKMDAVGAGVHTISFSTITNKFTFASSTLLFLYLTTTTNSLWTTIGFPVTPDVAFTTSYTGSALVLSMTYYTALPSNFPEIVDVQVDGVALTRKTNVADVRSTAQSWWQDFFAGILYVHVTAGDSPGTYTSGPVYKYTVVALSGCAFRTRNTWAAT